MNYMGISSFRAHHTLMEISLMKSGSTVIHLSSQRSSETSILLPDWASLPPGSIQARNKRVIPNTILHSNRMPWCTEEAGMDRFITLHLQEPGLVSIFPNLTSLNQSGREFRSHFMRSYIHRL